MTILMTGLCEKGADQIWKQCNDAMYAQGVTWLEEAAYAGDAEAWFFLGHCYSWGDGAVGFNEKKAYECYLRGASAGSARAVLGALRAGQYDEQMKQSARYSIEESYRQVRDAAEMGDVYAAWQMGEAVEWEDLADYMPQTESAREQCLFWYERAADGGIIPAMVKMGKCCQNGTYREKDEKEALRWANQCAASGEVWGLFQMGEHYRQEEDWEAAFQYDYAAAKQGSSRAMLYLGQMYLNGQGTERDIQAAVQALEEAAARNEAESFEELGNLFYQDELVERDDEKAFYWYGKAYASGIKEAALPLARLYLRPSDEQDTVRAEKLLREAAGIETDGQASLALGNIYRDGLNGEIDMKQAVSWYEKGASQGNPECMEILGCLYFQGEEGVDRDYAKAFEWLNRCEEAGSLQSASKLGYLYMKGEGCTADENKAKELFERAAQTECDGYALYELGFIYERKNESPEDLERAAQCYQKAIEMGNESASRRFSHFKKGLFGRWKITY